VFTIADRLGVSPLPGLSPNASFELPGPIITATLLEDYTEGKGANDVTAYGSGQGNSRPSARVVSQDFQGRPTVEYRFPVPTVGQLTVAQIQALTDYANQALIYLGDGMKTMTLTANLDAAPVYGQDWGLGDDVAYTLGGLDANGVDTVPGFPGGFTGTARAIGVERTDTTVEPDSDRWELLMPNGIPHPAAPDPWSDLKRRITDLESLVGRMMNAPSLENATIGQGGIRIINDGAISVSDSAGNKRLQLDENGLRQYDPSGKLILQLGTLNASPAVYGLGVLPYGGTQLQLVGGTLSATGLSASSVNTSNANVTFAGTATITAVIGPAGSVMIGGSFEIDTEASGVKAGVLVNIDSGAAFVEVAAFQVVSGKGTYLGGSTFRWDGLTPGTHTFTAQYFTSGATASINGSIYIQPL
jgi:hypothetical protein